MSGVPAFRDFQQTRHGFSPGIAPGRAVIVGSVEWEPSEASESAASILLFGLFKTPRVGVAAAGHARWARSVGTLAPILRNLWSDSELDLSAQRRFTALFSAASLWRPLPARLRDSSSSLAQKLVGRSCNAARV